VDNITHSLTGLVLSRAGLDRLTPRAAWILFLAANAPDIDVVSAFGGSLNYLHYHRHLTHSLIALPVLPLLCVLAVRLVSRKPVNWVGAYVIAFIGVASHLVLDLTNTYGVRVLLPFSAQWLHWDITNVIDLWIWGVLFISVSAPALARLVNAEIGAAAQSRGGARHGFAIFALSILALYEGARFVAHARAVSTLESRVYAGAAPSRVAALPGPVSLFTWRGIAETSDMVSIVNINLLGDFDPATGRTFYKPESSPAIEAARRTPVFDEFLRFSQYPFWQITPAEQAEGGTRVEAMDLRFGDPRTPAFVATAIVDANQRVIRAWYQFGVTSPR
jgi:inner membrane protein